MHIVQFALHTHPHRMTNKFIPLHCQQARQKMHWLQAALIKTLAATTDKAEIIIHKPLPLWAQDGKKRWPARTLSL